jgi:hypothetical protein
MREPLKNYDFEYDNLIYILKIYSEKRDDWEIWVYEEDKITFVEKFNHHEYYEKLPKKLRVPVELGINRGRKNIAADRDSKSS